MARKKTTGWDFLFEKTSREKLEKEILPDYLKSCRWFGGKAKTIQHVKIADNIPIETDTGLIQLLLLETCYAEGSKESYLLPLSIANKINTAQITKGSPSSIVTKLHFNDGEKIVYDSVYDEAFRKNILSMILERKKIKGTYGEITVYPGKKSQNTPARKGKALVSRVLNAEQSNTSILYGNKLFFKFYRRLEEGINPDFEIVKFLTEKKNFPYVPPFAGAVEYRRSNSEPSAVGMLQGFIPNKSDAWIYILGAVNKYFEKILARKKGLAATSNTPPSFQELIGKTYVKMIKLLGKRTGELHLSLSSAQGDHIFSPEPFSPAYQKSVYESMREITGKAMRALEKNF
jgi:maltose alpha-D-glucosyltransferase/alpha-amylase